MAYTAVITSGLMLLLLPNQTAASRFLLFVRHDEMNFTDAREACESFGGRLAVPGSFSEEEKLDVMQCIPPNVVFWTDQKGPKDACLVTFLLDIKCFYEKRFYQHNFLCEAERGSIRYSYYLRVGDVCSSQDVRHSTLLPVTNTTAVPSYSTTLTPVSLQTFVSPGSIRTKGTRPPGRGTTTKAPDITRPQREVNETDTEPKKNNGKSGNVSDIGIMAAVAVFAVIFLLSVVGVLFVCLKRRKPELLQKASFWKRSESVQNEYDTVRPRTGPEHSYGYMRSSDPPSGDYLQPNPSAIRSRNIDNIDYLVEADDNIITGINNVGSGSASAQENDYDYIHIEDTCRGQPAPYDLAKAIPNSDYEKCGQSKSRTSTLTTHDYYNTPDSNIGPPKVKAKPVKSCVTDARDENSKKV